ncbi:MAG: hypothetical protein ACOYM3_20670 [Terrimicrobiaceae bacterium]
MNQRCPTEEQAICGILLKLFPLILPFAVKWAERAEKRILQEGVPLSESQLSDARLMGVEHPERIRVLMVEEIPLPGNLVLKFAARITGLFSAHTAGMALRYGIFVRRDCWGDRQLIAHECVHTAQYESLGGFREFLSCYLRECLEIGYPAAPMEQEAILKSATIPA